ncbi:uncharacterized protein (TIGR02217 family) [Sphingomonas kaistensis]|uniref:Uncharacterized protein (TIGR02217 family) n=1 Tax=Sphingomonas kaistensis TaxID=298708 RepID=A0A7X5Y8G2_9SPHN|nr:DUF2460 domain-containing protein [Sphingomonas kaistensis]NJC06931.1 uncharacterized protein (TIGR02217 family) [Sphingomonas kaistensis]
MRHWLTRDDRRLRRDVIKRFEPSHWTVDFPRGSMACVVSHPGETRLTATATFGRKGDLVGLIFTTIDEAVHVAHRRHAITNYSRCTLRFRWRSIGLAQLDAVNGPSLTIEGRDEAGNERIWYVRLWNYATGSGSDATVELPFDRLMAGFQIDENSERIHVGDISRMFISLVPPGFVDGSQERFSDITEAEVDLSEIECLGSGSVIPINDAFVPEHKLRICTAYDDSYHLTPERVIDSLERLGYRGLLDHYVGMSHYPALDGAGLADPTKTLCLPARRWHESFAAVAQSRGYDVIWSLSMELLEELCPEAWKQRAWNGAPARTGWVPPSTLLSPAVDEAIGYLSRAACDFVEIGVQAGLAPKLQIGEPWWWVTSAHAICIYDEASAARWPVGHVPIEDVRTVSAEQIHVLDRAGALLSSATASIVAAVKQNTPLLQSHILIYLPSLLRSDAPEVVRANVPVGWCAPAFDVLQLEDYDWVTEGLTTSRLNALEVARARLGYALEDCHYLAGFVTAPEHASDWNEIMAAAIAASDAGFREVFLWALPQVLRDGLTVFQGEQEVQAFRDVAFPIELGLNATVEPCFSTTIATSPGGVEYRNADWQQARLRFDVGPCLRSNDELRTLIAFFREMRGNAIAFRLRDCTDFSSSGMIGVPSATDVLLGTGDGVRRRFPLIKHYGEGEERRITRPVAESLEISVGGLPTDAWSLANKGVVELAEAPAADVEVRAGFYFDVPVRFEEPSLRISHKTHLAGELISVPLLEVREG